MITIDQLRGIENAVIMYNGTGVVKLHIGKGQIYRFYSDIIPVVSIEIHEHRCNFTSTVLKGTLLNHIYEVSGQDPDSTLSVIRSKCEANAEKIIEASNVILEEVCNFTTVAGQSYYMAHNVLHQIENVTPSVVTLMEKELPAVQENYRIVMDTSTQDYTCPLSAKKSEEECWEIVKYILNDDK